MIAKENPMSEPTHVASPETGPAAVPDQESSHGFGHQTRRGGWANRIAFMLYRIVRPVIRPLVWRTRLFFIGPILQELAEIREVASLEAAKRFVPDPALTASIERLLLTLAIEQRPGERRPCVETPPTPTVPPRASGEAG